MCQQTRVETVVGYYARWMARLPTVEALAAADEDTVNAMWAGLGYYRRARLLHSGARAVVAERAGRLPRAAAELRAIPGIGPYTAGAISSIAFAQREPVVDGNVVRVLSRLRACAASPKSNALVALCWQLARGLVPEDRPGDFNQALMELGSLVCTPR
ncbi:Mutyh protein, partial [Tribonema minus]